MKNKVCSVKRERLLIALAAALELAAAIALIMSR